MLGTFHLIMMYMSKLSKRFKDAGLFGVLVLGSVLAEYSCESALSGKMYNRGVRAYKLVYEALISELIECLVSNDVEISLPKLSTGELTTDVFHDFIASSEFGKFKVLFDELVKKFSDSSDGNHLRKFWLSYIDMVELLLNILFSVRSGNWDLYLICLQNVVVYTFVYDNYNYARYLTAMLGTMLDIENTHPFVFDHFKKGFLPCN